MRFTIRTDNGQRFTIADRREVIAENVAAEQVVDVIANRMAGDKWRSSISRMKSTWNGYANQFFNKQSPTNDPWKKWASVRVTSWRLRAKAITNAIRRGDVPVRSEQYIQSRVSSKSSTWKQKYKALARSWDGGLKKASEWKRWAVNVASNRRKRTRERYR